MPRCYFPYQPRYVGSGLGVTPPQILIALACQISPDLITIAHLPSHLLSVLSFISILFLSCLLSRAPWLLLLLTRGGLNYSLSARIAAPRPLLFGAEMN